MAKRVLVGLSGGVDSAVCALILKKQGYKVIGATMSIWEGKIPKSARTAAGHTKNACLSPYEKEDIEAAKKIAEALDIPFYVIDCKKQYAKIVLENFKSEYLCGKTPNPCIRCNALIKFGVLPQLARKNGIDFDLFATGHYAKIIETPKGFLLGCADDLSKDQSYFLYRLDKNILSEIKLPLGEYTKQQIRDIARKNGLFVADKPDSQDFYDGNYNELVGAQQKQGNIVDLNGKILGTHNGIWNFTIGQRKGLKISSKEPLYVLDLNNKTNEVVIGPIDKTFKNGLIANDINWLAPLDTEYYRDILCKIRSNGVFIPSKLFTKNNNELAVHFNEPQKSVALGQSAVFYKDGILLGGGIIHQSL